jgi:hypothetical protein
MTGDGLGPRCVRVELDVRREQGGRGAWTSDGTRCRVCEDRATTRYRVAVSQVDAVLATPVFTVAGRTYRWEHVVEAARARGDWTPIVALAQRAAASARRARLESLTLPRPRLESASSRFRYQRGLISADELEAWLARWGLDVEVWQEWIRRSLWRQCLPDQSLPGAPEWIWTWIEAVCGGGLEQMAQELAERMAVSAPGDGAGSDAAFDTFCAKAGSPTAVARVIEDRRVDWIRVGCRYFAHPSSEVVREAALCIREDGLSLAEVAGRAHAGLRESYWYLEGAPADLRPHLLSARPGDVVGPLQLDDQHWLVEVADKVSPSIGDPELARRAQTLAVRRALDAKVSEHVIWHERL